MRTIMSAALVAVLGVGSVASAQSSIFNFEDGTDQGFGTPFGNDASASFPIVNIGGSNRMAIANTAGFQEAGRESGNPAEPFYQAMLAASANEAGYTLSYDYYVDAGASADDGTFLQVGVFVNTGSGYYAQSYGSAGGELELGTAELQSNNVYSGTVSKTFAARGFDLPAAQNFFRIGFIINGGGATAPTVYFDNIRIDPVVPEPTTLAGLAGAATLLRRRRRA